MTITEIFKKKVEISNELNKILKNKEISEDITSQVSKHINFNQVEASYLYLERMNNFIKEALLKGIDCYHIKQNLNEVAKKEIFNAMFDTFEKDIIDKDRKQLEKILASKHSNLLEELKIFDTGKKVIGEFNMGLLGKTMKDINNHFKENGEHGFANNYISYFSDELLKYYIIGHDLLNDEYQNVKQYINKSDHSSIKQFNVMCGKSYRIGEKLEKKYTEKYGLSPFKDLETNAFNQQVIKGIYPNR